MHDLPFCSLLFFTPPYHSRVIQFGTLLAFAVPTNSYYCIIFSSILQTKKKTYAFYKVYVFLVYLEGFEPPICKFVACHSIQLNYRYITVFLLYLFSYDYSSIFKKKLKNTCKAFEFVLYYISTLIEA